jgi:uncharacterized membrane protein
MDDSKKTARASESNRVVFVDQARAIAIMLMLFGHSLDRFLAEPWRSGDFYTAYQPVRGVSSTLFLMVAGFSFVIATFGHWKDYMSLTPRMWARIRRIGLILFLGYLLSMWAPTLGQAIESFSAEKWERFLRFDVLQNIGFGLAALHLIAWAAGRKEMFFKLTLGLAVAVFTVAAITYRKSVDAILPTELATTINLYHESRFPVVPYTGFLLLGAVFGYLFLSRKKAGDEWKVFACAIFASFVLIGFELSIRKLLPGALFPYSAPLEKMPGNTFGRAGCGLLAISALYFLGRRKLVLPRLSFILSKDALSIYFFHLFLVYGSSTIPGLFSSYEHGMAPVQVAFWVIGLSLLMTAGAWAIGRLRANKPDMLAQIRHTVILGGAIAFVALPELSAPGIAFCLGLAAAVVFAIKRRRSIRATADVRG